MSQKKTVFLHIGIGKTGTSSLQHTLFGERKRLLGIGCYYPDKGIVDGAHHKLAKLRRDKVPYYTRYLWWRVIRGFRGSAADKMVVSSENLCFVSRGYVKWLAEALKWADVKIVFYVRSQLELIPSTFLQWVKLGHDYKGGIEGFFESHKGAFDFEVRLKSWVEFFGEDSVLVRLYDQRSINGDIVGDFLRLIGLDKFLPERSFTSNPSLLPEFARILMLLDKHGIEPAVRKEALEMLTGYSPRFKKCSSLELVTPDLRRSIFETYGESNKRIASKYLSETDGNYFLEGFR